MLLVYCAVGGELRPHQVTPAWAQWQQCYGIIGMQLTVQPLLLLFLLFLSALHHASCHQVAGCCKQVTTNTFVV